MKEPASDLSLLLWDARTTALADGGEGAAEIAPGVLVAEARAAAWHAYAVQGGFSTPEIEAERLSKDRGGLHPTEQPDPLPDAETGQTLIGVPGEALPPLPESAYPAGAVELPAVVEPPLPVVNYEPGSRLEQLHAAYFAAKAESKDAESKLKAATDALKLELTTAAPGAPKVGLAGSAGAPLFLSYGETWRFDSKKFKADDPLTYVRYAKKSGSWTLRAGSAEVPE